MILQAHHSDNIAVQKNAAVFSSPYEERDEGDISSTLSIQAGVAACLAKAGKYLLVTIYDNICNIKHTSYGEEII